MWEMVWDSMEMRVQELVDCRAEEHNFEAEERNELAAHDTDWPDYTGEVKEPVYLSTVPREVQLWK